MLIYLSMIESDENKSKFELIYYTYKKLMLYRANRILGDMKDTEDVVHEAFLKIIKIIDQIGEPKCPKTKSLVVTIVDRTAIDLYRRRTKIELLSIDDEVMKIPVPEDIAAVETMSALSAAMATLPPKYRELILLRYDNGFTEAEVAQIMSMSQENVHKTIQRAKKKLAKVLDTQEA